MLKLKELRKELGLTQEQLAQKMNLKYYNIGDWERGKCEPSLSDLKKLAEIFDVTVDYLINNGNEYVELDDKKIILTQDEEELLKAYQFLSAHEKDAILIQAKYLADKHKI